jgi:hypothetical protein
VVALGDIDGDNIPDLAIGAPSDNDAGGVFIYSGADRMRAWLPSPILDVAAPGASFGIGLAGIGDADGDGDPDLAIGAPDVGNGRIEIFRSTGRDIDSTPINAVDGATLGSETGAAIANPPAR